MLIDRYRSDGRLRPLKVLGALPSNAISWRDPRLRDAWIATLIAAFMGLLLWPNSFINGDEYLYAGEARLLLEGRLNWYDGAALPGSAGADPEGIRFPFGWPLLLTPFAPLGFRALFIGPMIMHILGGLAFARMLVRRELPAAMVVVFLFHPLFWSFSRTLMSDVPAVALFLLAADAWEQRRPAGAGAALGYGLFMRLAGLFALSGFLLAIVGEWQKRKRALLTVVAAAAGLGSLVLLQNLLVSGHPLRSAYTSSNAGLLDGSMLVSHVVLYGLGFTLIPPFPGLWLLVRGTRIKCDAWVLSAVPVIIFFCLYSYHDRSRSLVQTFLGGQRLVLTAHAALLIGTARVWATLSFRKIRFILLGGALLVPLLHHQFMKPLYERYTPAVSALQSCNPRVVYYNRNAARIALASNARRFHMLENKSLGPEADVAVVALSSPTNQPLERQANYKVPKQVLDSAKQCWHIGEFYLFDLSGSCPTIRGKPCEAFSAAPKQQGEAQAKATVLLDVRHMTSH